MIRTRFFAYAILALGLSFFNVQVCSARELHTKADWKAAEGWDPLSIHEKLYSRQVTPNWIGENIFWYGFMTSGYRGYWLVKPESASREPLFDKTRLVEQLEQFTSDTLEADMFRPEQITVSKDVKSVEFVYNNQGYRYNRTSGDVAKITKPGKNKKTDPENCSVSPDGKLKVFSQGYDLFLMDTHKGPGHIIKLSNDGSNDYRWDSKWFNSQPKDTVRRKIDVTWSPDSKHFAVHRVNATGVGELWTINHLAQPRPTLKTYKYPMPAEEVVPQWELWIYNHDSSKLIKVHTDKWKDQTLEGLFHGSMWWSSDSGMLYFTRRHRDYKKVDLCVTFPESGQSMTVIEESLDGMVYIQPPVEMKYGKEGLWWSCRSGWFHYYHYSNAGVLINPLTSGEWHADEIVSVDNDSETVFLYGFGREKDENPYYRHLYRVNFDGSKLTKLTESGYYHNCNVSPDKQYFVDSYSNPVTPHKNVLKNKNGKTILEFEDADVSEILAAGWQSPEIFKAKASDGKTDLWGVMYKPFNFDPDKKYPIITRVYPGRHDEYVPFEFKPVNAEIFLSQLGCIVVRFGNLGGTYKRGLAYREYRNTDFRDYGLADKKVVVEQLGNRHHWIDLDRVGICGGSSGGFMTVSAMLVYPEFFKVGVAWAAPSDPMIYFKHWVERYDGLTQVADSTGKLHWQVSPEGNIELAEKLEGDLLIMHGELDDNVHPAHLYRMADAFIKSGKRIDMYIVPAGGHEIRSWRFRSSMIWEYFADRLIEGNAKGAQLYKW